MDTHQITFAIQGMREARANCAVTIEQALTQLDGVIAAHVNYATERATVMFVPARVSTLAMVAAVQNEGFQVPLEHITLNVEGLLYTTSQQTVERVLSRMDDVAQVYINLPAQQIVLDAFLGRLNIANYKNAITKLGLQVVAQPIPGESRKFIARTIFISALTVLSLFSAGAHAGLYQARVLHAPLVVMVLSVLVAYGMGWQFFHQAYETGLQGELDASVLLALAVSVSMFGGLVVALASPSTWLTGSGFVLAALLTAGWFIVRAVSVWVLPRFQNGSLAHVSMAQAHIWVTSNGSHH
jgi:Cu+-exporting ATPase